MTAYSAVVLAGGTASRLGGVDKCLLPVAGRPLLHRVLAALPAGTPTFVVGPPRPVPWQVAWVTERRPAGPVAALSAALPLVTTATVAVLAGDLPFLGEVLLARLWTACRGVDGAVAVDGDGREQWLLGVWRSERLRAALRSADDPAGCPMRTLVTPLRVRRVPAPPGSVGCLDVDTVQQLRLARRLVRAGGRTV